MGSAVDHPAVVKVEPRMLGRVQPSALSASRLGFASSSGVNSNAGAELEVDDEAISLDKRTTTF